MLSQSSQLKIDKSKFKVKKNFAENALDQQQPVKSGVYRDVNDYIKKQTKKLDFNDSDSSVSLQDAGSNDDVAFMIKKLQKETLKLKGVNTVQYRRLNQNIMKTRKEEK